MKIRCIKLLLLIVFVVACCSCDEKKKYASDSVKFTQFNITVSGGDPKERLASSDKIEIKLRSLGVEFDVNSSAGSIVLETQATTEDHVLEAIAVIDESRDIIVDFFEVPRR